MEGRSKHCANLSVWSSGPKQGDCVIQNLRYPQAMGLQTAMRDSTCQGMCLAIASCWTASAALPSLSPCSDGSLHASSPELQTSAGSTHVQAGDEAGGDHRGMQAAGEQLQPQPDQLHGEGHGDQWHWRQDLLP